MRKATITDLKLELWLRQRNSGNIYWETRDGRQVSINNMDNNHLVNTIKMLLRQEEEDEVIKECMFCYDPYFND